MHYGQQVIQMGTFSLSVNGTQVCADTASFAYNVYGGACTGAGIASSFINYTTGAYEITFSSPPARGAIIQASWTNIVSRNATNGSEQVDMFGNGTATSGFWSAACSRNIPAAPRRTSIGGCNSDWGEFNLTGGYAVNAIGFSQRISWFYGTKLPALIPGQAAAAPFVSLGFWRSQGSSLSTPPRRPRLPGNMGCDQWSKDVATPSTFTGTVTGGGTSNPVLTLNSAVTGSFMGRRSPRLQSLFDRLLGHGRGHAHDHARNPDHRHPERDLGRERLDLFADLAGAARPASSTSPRSR